MGTLSTPVTSLLDLDRPLEFLATLASHVAGSATLVNFVALTVVVVIAFRLVVSGIDIVARRAIEICEVAVGFQPLRRRLVHDLGRWNFCQSVRLNIENINALESWSDQSFTDLEANVEANGPYFTSWLTRALGKTAKGSRRVNRLFDAIMSSSVKRFLLLGEPGSGKSVAVRHLTLQLAARASFASRDFLIPLYINLRRMPLAPPGGPTAQGIHEYVFSELRRVIDDARYVRDKWDEYVQTGRWFFIFDSFDEIPDVLHAGSASHIIRQYGAAIQQFIDAKPACKAIVASREFKGPQHLPWEKFRILPLSVDRQEELIYRSSALSDSDAKRVRDYVASTNSDVYRNPMFLTLLCHAMKDGEHKPVSDYDLMKRHIDDLIEKGMEDVRYQWNIAEDELKMASVGIARALALHNELALEPTFAELARFLRSQECPEERLEDYLLALAYVKVLRSDIDPRGKDDRRFAFSHRRYQEALVVQDLVHGELRAISPAMLLTEAAWREYAVALLQSQPAHVTQELVSVAAQIVPEMSSEVRIVSVKTALGVNAHYELEGAPLLRLLELLQEGLRFRRDHVSSGLENAVSTSLARFWADGDLINRHTVLSVSGLMPREELESRIREVAQEPSSLMVGEAFAKTGFLSDMSKDVGRWLRATLASSVFAAIRREDLRRLEVAVAWAPRSAHADVVWKRCLRLHRIGEVIALLARPVRGVCASISSIYDTIGASAEASPAGGSQFEFNRGALLQFSMFIGWMLAPIAALVVVVKCLDEHKVEWEWIVPALIYGGFLCLSTLRYFFRTAPVRLFSPALLGVVVEWHQRNKFYYARKSVELFGFLSMSALILFVAFEVLDHFILKSGLVMIAVYFLMVFGALVALAVARLKRIHSRRRGRALLAELSSAGAPSLSIVPMARNVTEAVGWIADFGNHLLPGTTEKRAYAAWLIAAQGSDDWRAEVREVNRRRMAWDAAQDAIALLTKDRQELVRQ